MSERIDVRRLLGIATLLFAILVAYLTYAAGEPAVASAQLRLEEAEARLRADDALFAERVPLDTTAATLAHRYRAAFADDGQAQFVRDLDSDARRHGCTIVSTSFAAQAAAPHAQATPQFAAFLPAPSIGTPNADAFDSTGVTLQMRGSYRSLLAAISELSTGSQIVRVELPSLHRDGSLLVATVPATLLRPLEPGHRTIRPPATIDAKSLAGEP